MKNNYNFPSNLILFQTDFCPKKGMILTMKSKYIFLIIALALIIVGVAYYFYNSSKFKNQEISKNLNDSANYNTSKLGTTENSNNNSNPSANESTNNSIDNPPSSEENLEPLPNNASQNENNITPSEPKETEIASFSTKIYTKDSERQNNVSLTCSKLNDTIVENGKTFSFCNTVGKATSSKGYQKADVFKDGEKVKALGGGNCQVSSTLYNAVLKIPELNVTERHPHSNSVPYVKEGKDAAVSYGTYDFKFVNNTRKKHKNKM